LSLETDDTAGGLSSALRARLPRELRDLVYDELLTSETLEDMRRLMHLRFSDKPPRPSQAQIPHFLVAGLVHRDIIHEIVFHYYETGEYPPLLLPKHCDTFLRHDFYGVGIVGADIALPHLEIRYSDKALHHTMRWAAGGLSPLSDGNTFQSILEHKHIWKDPERFSLHPSIQYTDGDIGGFAEFVCGAHESAKELLSQA
jgi:hypothetical protein